MNLVPIPRVDYYLLLLVDCLVISIGRVVIAI